MAVQISRQFKIEIRVNVSNDLSTDVEDFRVQLNASLWNGTKTWNETFNSSYYNLSALSTMLVNFSWTVKIGTYIFDAYVDYDDVISETNELNNDINEIDNLDDLNFDDISLD